MKQVSKIILCLLCMAMALTGCRDKVRSKADTADPQAAVSQSMKRISKVENKEICISMMLLIGSE